LTELVHLSDLLTKKGDVFVDKLLNQKVLVNFKIDTSAFMVKNDGGKLRFYGREGKQELDLTKRAGSNIWEEFIAHIEKQDWKKLPDGVEVYMEMFNDKIPTIVKHASKPLNGLIISYCKKDGKILIPNDKVCEKAAKLLKVSPAPIMFDGKLSTKQKDKLKAFLIHPDTDTPQKFAKFVLSLFVPPKAVNSLIGDTMEGLVFYFQDGSTAKVIDPSFTQQIKDKKGNEAEFFDIMSKLVYNELEVSVDSILANPASMKKIMSEKGEKRYIRFVSAVTGSMLQRVAKKMKNVDSYRADVEKNRYSSISSELVPTGINTLVSKYWWAEDVFRIILYGIRKEKKRIHVVSGLTADRKNIINGIVTKLKENGIL
jgi:hypothetical protein